MENSESGKFGKRKNQKLKKKGIKIFFLEVDFAHHNIFRMLINQDYHTICFSKQNVPQMVRPPFILIMSCLSMNFLSSGICDLVPAMFVGVV